jgi:hypothetical protein
MWVMPRHATDTHAMLDDDMLIKTPQRCPAEITRVQAAASGTIAAKKYIQGKFYFL